MITGFLADGRGLAAQAREINKHASHMHVIANLSKRQSISGCMSTRFRTGGTLLMKEDGGHI
jgi:hypothetical protein